MRELIQYDLQEAKDELERFLSEPSTTDSIEAAARICTEALAAGCKIISCGNGGSLCDATHFAEELTGRYRAGRRSLPAIAINDPAYLTCTSNDFSYEESFSRYVEGWLQRGCVAGNQYERYIGQCPESGRGGQT